jgi:hypothetical protein
VNCKPAQAAKFILSIWNTSTRTNSVRSRERTYDVLGEPAKCEVDDRALPLCKEFGTEYA